MFAKVQIMGRTGNDPEVQYFESGSVKASVNVAVSEKFGSKSGDPKEKTEKTHWFKCEAWGKTAEIIANFITKGDLVMFDGVLIQETWNDKVTGQKRDKVLVKVERVHLLPNKRDGGDKNQVTSEGTRYNPEVQEPLTVRVDHVLQVLQEAQTNQANPDKVPDDIPF